MSDDCLAVSMEKRRQIVHFPPMTLKFIDVWGGRGTKFGSQLRSDNRKTLGHLGKLFVLFKTTLVQDWAALLNL